MDENEPRIGVFLYGLMCAVMEGYSEALLPDTKQSGHPHHARLFAPIGSTADPEDCLGPDKDVMCWMLDGHRVEFVPLNKDGNEIATQTRGKSDPRVHSDRHPFSHFHCVRDLPALTGKKVIAEDLRNDTTKVNCRVWIPFGHVSPVLPYSQLGRRAEWRARYEGDWQECATTDTLLYVRDDWPDGTEKIGVRRTPLSGGNSLPLIKFKLDYQQAIFTITHASDQKDPELEHTRAYANLVGMELGQFKVPKLARGCYGESAADVRAEFAASTRDGHCEISWDGGS